MSNDPTNTDLLVAGAWNNSIRAMEKRIAELEAKLQASRQRCGEYHQQLAEAQKDAERLLVLATKWCDKGHHDWQELLKIGGKDE